MTELLDVFNSYIQQIVYALQIKNDNYRKVNNNKQFVLDNTITQIYIISIIIV